MPPRHLLVALLTVAVWGVNFTFVKIALRDFPPFTLAAARFFLVAFPAVFFLPRPKVKIGMLAGYSATIFVLQFAFLFTGMRAGMSAGLSSMILQTQVFFTIGLSAIFLGERPNAVKLLGAAIAFTGVALVGLHSDHDVNLPGLLLLLGAALSWAAGNIFAKALSAVNVLALVVWAGLLAFPPLLLAALGLEGTAAFTGLTAVSAPAFLSLLYIVFISTHLGYSLWSWLLRQHSASTVAPFTLLVPIFGFVSSSVILGEGFPAWKIYAALLVVGGLVVNVYGSRKRD